MTHYPPELAELKQALHGTWTAGDYGLIARGMQQSAEAFVDRMALSDADAVLDIACGAGQLAIPAARTGARVTGLDLAEQWIAQARERAAAEGLDVRFDVGDAEALPYDDDEFDVVVSLIGVMFAPQPEVATAEMLRVCRPGGRIVLGNWTPEGFVGEFFKTVGRHVPPPDMPSPLLWGAEDSVRERLGPHVSELRINRSHLHFDYSMPPAEVVPHYVEHFGPVRNAHRALDADGQRALEADLEALWSAHNQADDGTTQVDGEILEIVAVR